MGVADEASLRTIWERGNNQRRDPLDDAHTSHVVAVAYLANGELLVSGSWDRTVRIWESKSGKMMKILGPFAKKVACLAVCETQKLLAVGFRPESLRDDGDTEIKFFSWDTAGALRISEGKSIRVDARGTNSLAFSKNGRWIAAACRDQTAPYVWEVESGMPVANLPSRNDDVSSVAFSPTQPGLLAVSTGLRSDRWIASQVYLVDVARAESPKTIAKHRSRVRCLAFSSDGRYVAAGGNDGTVVILDTAGTERPLRVRLHSDEVTGVAFSSAGNHLVSSSYDGDIRRLDLREYSQLHSLIAPSAEQVFDVDLAESGTTVVAACMDGKLHHWDRQTSKLLGTVTSGTQYVFGAAVSSVGKWLAYSGGSWPPGDRPGEFAVFRANAHDQPILRRQYPKSICWAIDFSPTQDLMAVAVGNDIELWDVAAQHKLSSLKGHPGPVRQLMFSDEGSLLSSVSMHGKGPDALSTAIVWNVATREHVQRFTIPSGSLYAVAIAEQPNLLAYSATDKIFVHDIRTGEQIKQLGQHSELIFALDITQDGKRVFSAGQNGQAKLWNIETGACLLTWDFDDWLWAGGFAHDDKYVVVGAGHANDDGAVYMFDATDHFADTKE